MGLSSKINIFAPLSQRDQLPDASVDPFYLPELGTYAAQQSFMNEFSRIQSELEQGSVDIGSQVIDPASVGGTMALSVYFQTLQSQLNTIRSLGDRRLSVMNDSLTGHNIGK